MLDAIRDDACQSPSWLNTQPYRIALAQGALASWVGPVRAAFPVPKDYRLICGLSLGYASANPINGYDPGRTAASDLRLSVR